MLAIMIDWLTAVIPLPEPLRTLDWHARAGYTLHAKPGGEIERIVDRWLPVEGSYAAGLRVRIGSAGLWLSGNPTKFLTGQNVDGPAHLPSLLAAAARSVLAALDMPESLAHADARLTRVDTTYSLDLGSLERVREVLRVASLTARARHQGRSQTAYQTVYLGQHSRRHSCKLYSKGDELRQHPPRGLPPELGPELVSQAAGLLRVEVTIRGQQLTQDRIDTVSAWDNRGASYRQWARYWGKVELNGALDLADDEVLALPRRLRATYELWRRGVDCKEFMSNGTYYRHRADLLRTTGGAVDIGTLRPPVLTAATGIPNLGAWLHSLTPYKAGGRLAEWIDKTAA